MIPFHRPSIGEDEIAAAVAVMRSGWLTTGAKCQEFEERFAAYLGVRHAVVVNSATAALHLALEAWGIGPGDEVVVPTYTFTACGEVVAYTGAKVILADVDENYLLGPGQMLEVLSSATRVVMPVHFAGQVVDVEELRRFAPRARFLEDAAHALPLPVVLGNAAAFSFYATKTMTTGGEGGMLVTDDDLLAARARSMRLHGISADAWNRYGAGNRWAYEVSDAGFKYNLTDLAAAIGLVQLGRLGEMQASRQRIAERYDQLLAVGAVQLPPRGGQHAWHLYVIRVDAGIRDRVIRDLAEQEIGASVHFIPLHLHPYYQRMGYQPGDFPVAERLYSESISLPIWPDMSDEQVDRVASSVLEALHARSNTATLTGTL